MKPITSDNYQIRPFRARKSWTVNYTFLTESVSPHAFIDIATEPPETWTEIDTNSPRNPSGTYKSTLYRSIQNIFYNTGSTDSSSSVRVQHHPRNKGFHPTGSEFYVVNVPQQTFGEKIVPTSFTITTAASTASIYDDGQGRLVSNVDDRVVGNIFYEVGIAVVAQATGSNTGSLVTENGMFLTTGSAVTLKFDGRHTIYEHQIVCTMDPSEFNFSSNPSMDNYVRSGSVSASVFVPSDGPLVGDAFLSGTLSPYMTTIGLYNDVSEMIAVAKFPRPLRRMPNTQQTVIIRFDA